MDETAITQYITTTFPGSETTIADDNLFFFTGPDHMFPFVTLMVNDANDTASQLDRPGIFRLNIGIGKEHFQWAFGARPRLPAADDMTGSNSDYDFTALDQLLPHPVYGRMFWVSILNPSDATFDSVLRPLIAEAYDLAAVRDGRRAGKATRAQKS